MMAGAALMLGLFAGNWAFHHQVNYIHESDGWLNYSSILEHISLLYSFFKGTVATTYGTFGQGTGPIFLSNLGCNGSEARLEDCAWVAGRTCSHREDAGVRCQRRTGTFFPCTSYCSLHCTLSACAHGNIRLIGTSNELAGRVEVCIDGLWGTVCDILWGRQDAEVACRQLGYSSSGKVYKYSGVLCIETLLSEVERFIYQYL